VTLCGRTQKIYGGDLAGRELENKMKKKPNSAEQTYNHTWIT
jgi:hypothetical protein